MNSTEEKIGALTHSEFLDNIKDGSVKILFNFYGDEKNLFWKTIHSVKNLQIFYYRINDFKKDLEENLPKMIENNHILHTIKLDIPLEICEFNTKYLYQTLQKREFQCVSIFYPYRYSFEIGYEKMDNQEYLESLLGCFENCTISSLVLERLFINDRILMILEKIKCITIHLNICRLMETLKYFIQSPNVILYCLLSKQDDFIYKFIENFTNIQELDLVQNNFALDFSKLKSSLIKYKLKNLSLLFNDHKNENYLKDIVINVTNGLNIQCEASKYSIEYPIFTYLKDNQSLKSFNSSFENYTDLDLFLQNNQSITHLELSMKSFKQNIHIERYIQKLGNGMLKNDSLEHLHLEIPLNDGFEYLYKGMINKNNLKNLEFSHCEMNDEVCKLFGDYLQNNSSITDLSLYFVELSMKGLKYILNGIIKYKSLKSFKLYNNSIEEEVYECFKELLISNQHLNKLKVQGKFNGRILKNVSEGLLFNSSLTDIFFDIHEFISKNLDDFEENLFYNQSLKNIDFGYFIKIKKNSYLDLILKRNYSLIQTLFKQIFFPPHDIEFNFH